MTTRRCAPALPLLVLVAGCGRTVSSTCEETAREVADDELLPTGATVAELAAAWFAPVQIPARWHDDRVTELSISAARADGTAEWVDLEAVTVETRGGPPFSKTHLLMQVTCHDHVRFPVDLSVVSEDGDLDVHDRATARVELVGPSEVEQARIELEAGPEGIAGMPAFHDTFGDARGDDGEPLAPDASFVRVKWSAPDDVSATAGWSGSYVRDDGAGVGWVEILVSGGAP